MCRGSAFDRELAVRARDLVRLGLDGHRSGIGWLQADGRARIERALEAGRSERVRQLPDRAALGWRTAAPAHRAALVSDPALILADEPLLSLDLGYQQVITGLLDERRRTAGTPVVFITHDINPVWGMVDRVLYLAPGDWAIGTPDEVLTSETLSHLYGTDVDVLRVRGRIVVVGTPDDQHVHHVDHDH
jgi:zinc/manganese transport system ATP-binding protein